MPIDFGISKNTFATEYWEQRYLLMRGAVRDVPFSIDDVDQLLHVTEPGAPFMRLHNGAFIPEESYIETYNDLGSARRRLLPVPLYGWLKAGATMILNRVDARQPLIRSLCLEVAQFVSQHTLANGYLSFGQQTSFGNHWDCHDVFAVQLHGKKRWQLFEPTFELPLANQTSKHVKGDCPAEPVLDVVLEAGDVLYVPRGWWHCATPIGEETFHVAIGVHPPFVADYVSWLCTAKLPESLTCRRSLSFERPNEALLQAAVADIVESLTSASHLEEYLSLISNSDRVPSPFDLRQGVGGSVPPIAPETVIRMNTVYPRHAASAAPLTVNGRAVALSESEKDLLARFSRQQHTSMRELQDSRPGGSGAVAEVLHGLIAKDLVQLMPNPS